jgi:LysM repeat protein
MLFRWLRRLFLFALVVAVFAVVAYFISSGDEGEIQGLYNLQVTLAIQTAVAGRLFDATRTAEASLPQYRLLRLGEGESLLSIAEQYGTTVEVLRMANQLLTTVDFGSGETIIVPVGMQVLDPPRSFQAYVVVAGDTLNTLATRFDVTIEQLQADNPVLAGRELLPGDTVFIPALLT